LIVDLRAREFAAPPPKVTATRAMALQLAQSAAAHRRWVNKKQLARFVGTAVALSPAIPTGRFRLVALYEALASVESWAPSVFVRLSNQAYRALTYFWTKLATRTCVNSWDPREPDELLFTDASDFGLGAHTAPVSPPVVLSGNWSPSDSARHITFKELKVVQLTLEAVG
jgi:hypothetical protein